MRLTIRGRLTLWYTSSFFLALIAVLAALAWELQRQLGNETHKALQIEENWLTTLIQSEFLPLRTLSGERCRELATELNEELDERYGMKRQFAVLALAGNTGEKIFCGGLKEADKLLPVAFLERQTGTYNIVIAEHRYRVRLFRREWGMTAVGVENETPWKVAKEAGEVLIWLVPLAALLTVAGGWLMARLALRPVASAAQAAEAISVENLKQRLPAYTGKDEFGALVTTLNRMIAHLEQGVTRLQQFTQDAAHELRTPLTILRGDLELAYQDEKAPEETRVWLQKVLDRVIALGQIVDNLMLLARSDSGGYPLNKTPFRLDIVVQEIFEDVKILAEARGLTALLHDGDGIEFFGDELLMRRLLMNLCDNALKYTPGGKLELHLRRSERAVELIIADTGIGIPAEDLPHIFDRFYRVDKSHTTATGGSGLGLAICKWIVEAHNGELMIDSTVGVGTTVRVLLPYHK
ncbi:MAG: Adaptive-response sensory-kinase SasA [Syntrophorhabdaceae bacterium]|nr:Adaptive-response sensory-kinase SasA [Syntrophorhabdaceae bacterium]